MRTGRELYDVWAPPESIWSPWVAPALFAQIGCGEGPASATQGVSTPDWIEVQADSATALVIDLPGAEALRIAFAVARRGYRPVLVVNASPAPTLAVGGRIAPWSVALDMSALVGELCAGTPAIGELTLPPNAPPAFVLDANRRDGTQAVKEEIFDNRWLVFPQDFPSARLLKERGLRRVLLVQSRGSQPREDLAHVLLRWQEAGIEIELKLATKGGPPERIRVAPPSRFRAMWYRALALLGFRRGTAGGFGAVVSASGLGG